MIDLIMTEKERGSWFVSACAGASKFNCVNFKESVGSVFDDLSYRVQTVLYLIWDVEHRN